MIIQLLSSECITVRQLYEALGKVMSGPRGMDPDTPVQISLYYPEEGGRYEAIGFANKVMLHCFVRSKDGENEDLFELTGKMDD